MLPFVALIAKARRDVAIILSSKGGELSISWHPGSTEGFLSFSGQDFAVDSEIALRHYRMVESLFHPLPACFRLYLFHPFHRFHHCLLASHHEARLAVR